jgi:hypothetical protein
MAANCQTVYFKLITIIKKGLFVNIPGVDAHSAGTGVFDHCLGAVGGSIPFHGSPPTRVDGDHDRARQMPRRLCAQCSGAGWFFTSSRTRDQDRALLA